MRTFFFFVLSCFSCSVFGQVQSFNQREFLDYYDEVCHQFEYGGRIETGTKFKKDVKVFVYGDKPVYMMTELNKIIDELNGLIETIHIEITENESEQNLFIYFGEPQAYMSYMKDYSLKETLENNWGAFWIYRGSDRIEITHAEVFINTIETRTNKQRLHLLREEFTQALGFPNDSYKYPESIFQQNWTEVTAYAEIDKAIIQKHYREKR